MKAKDYTRYVVLEQYGPKLKERTFQIRPVRLPYHGHHTIIGFAKTKTEALNLRMRAKRDGA